MAIPPKHTLADIRVLIADNDHQMATVLSHLLKRMGFTKVLHARNGKEAIGFIIKQAIDIVITDWQMPHTDGIELTRFIRSDESPNRSLPIIMLTARAEKNDVEASRDAGITEFLVKPYTSKTLFNRIQQLVDNPREFVIAPGFVGPTRRRRVEASAAAKNRRTITPKVVTSTVGISLSDGVPKILSPDFVLKKRIGIKESLSTIITTAVLDEAQKAIDTLKDESLGWIKEDLKAVESFYSQLKTYPNIGIVETLKSLLLSIKSRAGTFGYKNASDAAQIVYRFMRNDFMVGNDQHMVVLLKNIQALKVLLGNSAQGKDEAEGKMLLQGLQAMAAKFQQSQGQ